MAVPKKRVSRTRRNMRRAHDFLTRTFANICPNCGEPILPHHVCTACGQYRGRQIMEVKSSEKSA